VEAGSRPRVAERVATIAFPAALAPSIGETGRRIVSVVTADIDADGDLDVVASDGSLDLVVFVNDGAGHLSRKQPSRSNAWQPLTPGPGLGERRLPSTPSAQNDPPSFGLDLRSSCRPFARARAATARPDVIAPAPALFARTPRAPPAPSSRA